ncbi:histidine--tRNA ligase [Psychroserpens algicola]|uniref:Histidine--tRNA ligase n=1 Tax=Psychroserpens algicola TaxID=1719034 RepID=A0ABT0HCC9_9FLAO|nr:histidine--tRNA ligase [Psychroserpens algicola]MCK8482018.1 histidine--tRNA ligase [Psychroserpens algicola]
MAQKPSIPKGTRDFNPQEVAKRNYIFNTIRTQFEIFGFQPIETPSFENSETLMGKYGDEGDRLIFKILNSGDYFDKFKTVVKDLSEDTITGDLNPFYNIETNFVTKHISEKALRYDLTVPFARYVVQHQNEIDFPFKRYQIQPVWRADRPQKGRFREFYQCDADVVGSDSLWQEVEFVQLYDAVFTALGLHGVTIKINNRKILSGIADVIGAQDKLIDFTVALDKLDKIGEEKVKAEMLSKGIPQSGIDRLQPLFNLKGDFGTQISELKEMLSTSEEGKKGIEELEFINTGINTLGLKTATLQLDVTLARGLNYYTGAIFEVAAPEGVKMGSIGGGGRYDDLTGIFGLKDVSGVGISFGLDRIALVLEDLNLFPETITNTVKVLFINFGEAEAMASMKAIKALREKGVSAELFPDHKKTIKQFNYANKRNIPFVVLLGESELSSHTYTLKNMSSGEQQQLTLDELISALH